MSRSEGRDEVVGSGSGMVNDDVSVNGEGMG